MSLRWLESAVTIGLVAGFGLAVIMLGIYLSRVRVHEPNQESGGIPLFNAIADFAHKRRVFEAILDVVLVTLAYFCAYLLRWDGRLPDQQLAIFVRTLPVIIIVGMCSLLFGGVYRGLWRYIGIDDLFRILRSVLAASVASTLAVFLMYRANGPSRGVFLLDSILFLTFIAGSRLSFRVLRFVLVGRAKAGPDAKPVLIYGAGDGGEYLIREILDHHGDLYAPVGFIDDDHRKSGRLIHGYRIFGSDQLPQLIHAFNVEDVIVSSPKVLSGNLDRLRNMGLSLKMLSVTIQRV